MISAFVASYGYLAVFIGTLLEGETLLVAAGFAAHRGLLDLPLVVLVAAVGGTLGDQLAFLIGRWKGEALIDRFPALARHKPRVDDLLRRHAVVLTLFVRFLYGLRIAGPVLLGSSRMPVLRFAVLNIIGAVLWATVVAGPGYAFGLAINAAIANVKRIEELLLVAIVALGGLFWLWHRARARQHDHPNTKEERL